MEVHKKPTFREPLQTRLRDIAIQILQSPLLNLPIELRLWIYELVFCNTNSGLNALSLLLVNRQIYSEAWPVALPHLRVKIENWSRLDSFMRVRSATELQRIKHLHLYVHQLNDFYEIPHRLKLSYPSLQLITVTMVLVSEAHFYDIHGRRDRLERMIRYFLLGMRVRGLQINFWYQGGTTTSVTYWLSEHGLINPVSIAVKQNLECVQLE